MDSIYLDNNATTPLLPAVADAMRPCLTECFGNPASAHSAGRRARQALEDARERTATLLDAHPDEVIFTSGATEANNLALLGLAGIAPAHLITSPIEHPSVAEPMRRLAELGSSLDRLPVDGAGIVRLATLADLVRPDTRLVAVMLASNETGAVQPIAELVRVLRTRYAVLAAGGFRSTEEAASPSATPSSPSRTPLFHCDAAQAVGRLPVRFHDLGVDALTLSAHKFHGPAGVGALLLRRGVPLTPQLWGGHQQRGRRPGTEPVALAVGLAAALELWQREHEVRLERVTRLRARFLGRLRTAAGPVVLNGPETGGVPHTVNVSFPGCQAEALLMVLDLAGVCCSTGSACSSGSLLPSPVLQAMGVPEEVLHSAMRFSLSPLLTEADIDEAARRVAGAVERLRQTASDV